MTKINFLVKDKNDNLIFKDTFEFSKIKSKTLKVKKEIKNTKDFIIEYETLIFENFIVSEKIEEFVKEIEKSITPENKNNIMTFYQLGVKKGQSIDKISKYLEFLFKNEEDNPLIDAFNSESYWSSYWMSEDTFGEYFEYDIEKAEINTPKENVKTTIYYYADMLKRWEPEAGDLTQEEQYWISEENYALGEFIQENLDFIVNKFSKEELESINEVILENLDSTSYTFFTRFLDEIYPMLDEHLSYKKRDK